jgi:hypothetical protein
VPQNIQSSSGSSAIRPIWRWIIGIAAVALVILIAVAIVISRAEPILRARVLETLSTRFKGEVELGQFHVTLSHGVKVQGTGLKIYGEDDPNMHKAGVQPLIAVSEFRFRAGLLELLRSPMRVDTVYVKGLQLNLPPREQQQQTKRMRAWGHKIRIYVQRFICEDAQLVINTARPDKLPLEFNINHLKMTGIGPGQPLQFEANLINPKPLGDIASRGSFGPWQADSPRDTQVRGTYSFNNADLGTIKGIGGILSSTGEYAGSLDRITVDGTTNTPDFHIDTSGHPVLLQTKFHAMVDGTSGDTYLQPVRAKLLHSLIVAQGSVLRVKNVKGHHILLDVTVENGRMEDLLQLGVRTDPPVMTGAVQLKMKLDLPPGAEDVPKRLKLAGNFRVSDALFTNRKVQGKIDNLSLRSQGKPKLAKDDIPDNVPSSLSGVFKLSTGLLSFSQLHFEAPGTLVRLTGRYSLDGNQFDFRGKARLDAKPSQMVTGWKSLLLKPVDPFLNKHGAGTEVAVKITGTKSEPHFGLDLGRKDSKNKD